MRLGESIPPRSLGSPPIVADYLEGMAKARTFFPELAKRPSDWLPTNSESWPSPEERRALTETLLAYQEKHGGSEASRRNARRLEEKGVFAVVTGQQPGFLLGPLYTLLKAATAIRLARELDHAGCPAIPLFWNHSEDHDLAEVNHAFLPGPDGAPRKFQIANPYEKKFLSSVRLEKDAVDLFGSALAALAPEKVDTEIAALFRPRPGNSLAAEASRILLALFAKEGLVVAEPSLLRPWSHKALVELLRSEPSISCVLEERRGLLRRAGYAPIVGANQSLLFEAVGEQRLRIEHEGDSWLLPSGARLASGALAREIERAPSRFSPGVLLRPLTQCRALPVAAYVGGPAEIAYSAENAPLFETLGKKPPRVLPRFSSTLIETEIRARLESWNLSAADALAHPEALAARIGSVEPESARALTSIESELFRKLDALEKDLREIDPGLPEALQKTKNSVRTNLGRLREKTVRAAQSRAGAGPKEWKRVMGQLLPNGRLQERVLSSFYFLARNGARLASRLAEICDPFEAQHRIVYFEPED